MTTATKPNLKIHVNFQYDQDTESPFEMDCFELLAVDACGGHQLSRLLDTLKKEDEGKTWWVVSCYRHGGEHWFLKDQAPVGADQWDTQQFAGVLHLPSGDPSDVGPTPQKAAESILETYNRYCSGDCWYYRITYEEEVVNEGNCPCCDHEGSWITKEDRDFDAPHGGIIGLEFALEELKSDLESFIKQHPGSTDEFEASLGGDSQAMAYSGDIQDKIRETGFRFSGDDDGQ